MADYQIGTHTFQLLEGAVPARQVAIEVITKRGEDGHVRRQIGDRSDQFSVIGKQHYPDFTNARNAFEAYTDTTVGGIQTFCKDGVNFASLIEPYGVVVVKVDLRSMEKHHCIAGTTNTIWLESIWNLLLVPFT